MHYNWFDLGWTDPNNSPNWATNPPPAMLANYVFTSAAEWKVNKAACGLTGVTLDPAKAAALAHDSPDGMIADNRPAQHRLPAGHGGTGGPADDDHGQGRAGLPGRARSRRSTTGMSGSRC